MNLLYDLIASQPTSDGDFHGGGKYAKKVFIELIRNNEKSINIYGLYNSYKALDNDIQTAAAAYNITLIDVKSKPLKDIFAYYKISRYYSALPYNIAFNFFDVFSYNCEVIVTIHGLRQLEIKMNFESLKYFHGIKERIKAFAKVCLGSSLRRRDHLYYKRLLQQAKVITVSNHSRYAIEANFPNYSGDIKVFYSPDVAEIDEDTNKVILEHSNYFLLVSGNRWIKNNFKTVIALDQLFSDRKEINNKVVITGVTDKQLYLKGIKNKDRFILYSYVSEEVLAALYQNAFAFIYMSLNEGFGYPPIEAMKWGIPVIASPFTSIPEICGDAVIYSNPNSVLELKNRILQLFDNDLYLKLKEKSIERYTLISNKQNKDLLSMVKFILGIGLN